MNKTETEKECNRMSKNTSQAVLPATTGSLGVCKHAFQRFERNANACGLLLQHPQRVANCEFP